MGARRTLVLAVTYLTLTACGDEPASTPSDPAADPGDRYTTTATVIEAPAHGPRLCWSVMESNPPQCGYGIEVVGWDWTVLDGSEAAGGTTWGKYVVVGTYDGRELHRHGATEAVRRARTDAGTSARHYAVPAARATAGPSWMRPPQRTRPGTLPSHTHTRSLTTPRCGSTSRGTPPGQ